MFIRTNNGLANEHLFYHVDFVVYCEGEEVAGEASSLDEVFWKNVFSKNGKSVRCKSMGSKSVLRPLAQKVVTEGISNVVIAMDRDYDDLRGSLIHHSQVIYTYGYSWESDVMLDFHFDSALALFVTTTHRKSIHDDFKTFHQRQSEQLRRVFALDYKYIAHNKTLFDRNKPLSIVAFGVNFEPCIKINTLLKTAKTMGRFQTAPLPSAAYKTACGIRSFFGKTVARLMFHWFAYRTKCIAGRRKAHYGTFMSLLAGGLNVNDSTIPRNVYYSDAIARV